MNRFNPWKYFTVAALIVAAIAVAIIYNQRQQLQHQSTALVAEVKPDLPLSVGFRRALLGAGLVMELRNNSASTLEVAAVFSSAATNLTQRRNLVLPPNRVMQLGYAQGWAFVSGQRITFTNVNYRPGAVTVPGSTH